MIWNCAEHRFDNREIFLLLLSRVYTELRPFLLFFSHADEEVGGAWELGRRHSQDRWPKLTWGKKEEGNNFG